MGNNETKLDFKQCDNNKPGKVHTRYDPSKNIIDQVFKYKDEYTHVYVHNVMYSISSINNEYEINGMMISQSGIVLTTIETLFTDISSIDNFFKELYTDGFVDGSGLLAKRNNFMERYEEIYMDPKLCSIRNNQCTESLQLACYLCCQRFCFNHIGKTICGLEACFQCIDQHNKFEHTKCICGIFICSEFKKIHQLCQLCNKPSHKRKTIEIKTCAYCDKSNYSSIDSAGLTYYNPEHTLVCCDCASQSYNVDTNIKNALINHTILPNEITSLISSYTKILKINNFICEFCDSVVCYKHHTKMINKKTADDHKYQEICKNTMDITDDDDQMLFCQQATMDSGGEYYYETIPSKPSCHNCHNKLCKRKLHSAITSCFY